MTRIEIGEDVLVRRGGEEIPLPKSRKARALVAYLLFETGPASRERLCELFWDRAADPRGGLRWALTRIRKALGPDQGWLTTDRLTVRLEAPPQSVTLTAQGDRLLALVAGREHDDFALWLADLRRRLGDAQGNGKAAGKAASAAENAPRAMPHQVIRYTRAADGTRIAYAAMGDGPPLMKAANWLGHLEAELDVGLWSGLYRELAARYSLYRYDERGSGLSDWRVDEISFSAFVSDLECVADALELERFPLIGISQGGAVSLEYAACHPERVSALVLIGAYPAGWRFHPSDNIRARREAEMRLVELGWGDDSAAYRQIFSQTFLPDAPPELIGQFNEFQRRSTSPANAARFIDSFGDIDVRDRLSGVQAPALVMHSEGDQRISIGVGEELAASLPNARFETLNSANHVPYEGEPAFARMIEAIAEFLGEVGCREKVSPGPAQHRRN